MIMRTGGTFFRIILLLGWLCLDCGLGVADVGTHQGKSIFVWPSKSQVPSSREARKAALAEQIRQYSQLTGNMRRVRHEPLDGFWDQRKLRLSRMKGTGCNCVRKNLVEKLFSNPLGGYFQYGNCGEGAVVTICLAKHYGFAKKDVLHCQNRYKTVTPGERIPRIKHQFGLLRDGDTWCLLDRWNRFQGGLKLVPIMEGRKHLSSPHDRSRKLYLLTTPNGGSFFAGPRASEQVEVKGPTFW